MALFSADADRVLNAGISLALDKLVGQGAFFPFGVALTAGGEIKLLTAAEDGFRPKSETFLEALGEALAAGARSGDFVVVAIVADFAFDVPARGGERDAIRLSIESASGAATCYLPYRLVTPGGTRDVRPGELFARRADPAIFIRPG